jgi:hypothetical protein
MTPTVGLVKEECSCEKMQIEAIASYLVATERGVPHHSCFRDTDHGHPSVAKTQT